MAWLTGSLNGRLDGAGPQKRLSVPRTLTHRHAVYIVVTILLAAQHFKTQTEACPRGRQRSTTASASGAVCRKRRTPATAVSAFRPDRNDEGRPPVKHGRGPDGRSHRR
jgi:hypothetical protein